MDRSVISLLSWLDADEAVYTLLERRPNVGEVVSTQLSQWETAKAALNARPVYSLETPTPEPLPEVLNAIADTFVRRNDVITSLTGLNWELALVDLERVLSFQKVVVSDQVAERVQGVTQEDWERLFKLCLPEPAPEVQMRAFADLGGKALTLSSLNPNLRVAGQMANGIPGQNMKFIGFGVNLGASFVQVAEYSGRWFLRDGYHRCFGLIRNGIKKIPCVFVRAKSFAETGAERPGFFTYQILFGERPPFVTDFVNPDLSVVVKQPAIRKVVRITAEEFVVEV